MTDKALSKYGQFQQLVKKEMVIDKFESVLGEDARGFIASLTSIVADSSYLQKCNHKSILASAIKAAVLNLPIEQSLGFAYVVPYGRKATFVLGYKGMIQLALRTNQYQAINADAVFQGEEITECRLSGNIKITGEKISDEAIGYFAYFKMTNGFEKYTYMTVDEVHAHAKKFSKSYGHKSSAWTTNFPAMAKKTVLRRLLGRWGLMSIKMIDEDVPVSEQDRDDPRFSTPEDIEGAFVPEFDDVDVAPTPAEQNEAVGKAIEDLQRPYPPEELKQELNFSYGKDHYEVMNFPDNARQIFAAQLNTLFGGDTQRYEWCTGMFGTGTSKDIPSHCIYNTLDWLEVDRFNAPPSAMAISEAHQSMEWVKGQIGQQKMKLEGGNN